MKYRVTVTNGETHESSTQTFSMENDVHPSPEQEAEKVLEKFYTNVDINPDYFTIDVTHVEHDTGRGRDTLYVIAKFRAKESPVHDVLLALVEVVDYEDD
jgi:hypothetical protein